MATSSFPTSLAYFEESVPGTGPTGAAEWLSDGVSIRCIDVDPSGLAQSMLDDERNQDHVQDYDPRIFGIKGGVSFPHSAYLHGHADTAVPDSEEPDLNALAFILSHALGGIYSTASDLLVAAGAHSPTAIELTDTIPRGAWVQLADANGIMHQRRIMSSAAGAVGQIHQLHRALPFTPTDGARAAGCHVIFIDEDALEDSTIGGTLSWLIEKGRGSQRRSWECRGCVTHLDSIELGRNEVAKVSFSTLVASFDTPESAPSPAWSTVPEGSAGLAIGPRTRVFVQTRGTTTDATVHAASFELTPGVVKQPVETVTENDAGMPGVGFYTWARNRSELTMQIAPHADSNLTVFNAQGERHIQFERNAPEGSAWSIYLPRAMQGATPAFAEVSDVLGQTLMYDALHLDSADAMERSRIQIVLG